MSFGSSSLRRPAILVVDDDRDLREMLEGYLGRGHDVRVASDGEEALALARDQRPDLVLLDVMMPRLSGHSVAWVFKNDPRYRGVPVVFMTAHAAGRPEIERQLHRADGHILKPFTLEELAAMVGQFVSELPRAAEPSPSEAQGGEDRRLCPRRSVDIQATLTSGGLEQAGVVTSISHTGAHVECSADFVAGTAIEISFQHGGGTFRAPGRVLYGTSRDRRSGLGIRFGSMSLRDEQILDAAVSSGRSEAPQC